MKTIPVSFLLAGLLLPAVCLAQPPPAPDGPPRNEKGQRHGPDRAFGERLKTADLDHDGLISIGEFGAIPRIQNLPEEKRKNLFNRLDKNGDGKLSKDELGHMGKPRDGKGPPMARLWELDSDKSGGISLEEFKKGQLFMKLPPEKQAAVFLRLDTNGDGVITPQDRPERPNGRPHPNRPDDCPPDNEEGGNRINRKLDVNSDGALSFEEFRVGAAVKNLTEDEQEQRFELLDTNKDLKISPEDFPPPVK